MDNTAQNPKENKYTSFYNQGENFVRVSQAASLLNISPSTLRRLESEGKIKSERLDNNYRAYRMDGILQLKDLIDDEKKKRKEDRDNEYKNKIIQKVNVERHENISTPVYNLPINIQKAPIAQVNFIKNYNQPATEYKAEKNKITEYEDKKKVFSDKKVNYINQFSLTSKTLPFSLLVLAVTLGTLVFTKNAPEDLRNKISGTLGMVVSRNAGGLQDQTNNFTSVLAARSKVSNFIYNVNIPTNFREDISVDGLSTLNGGLITNNADGNFGTGTVTMGTLTFIGNANQNNLQNFDEVSENTYERLIDINGDVVGIGLNDVKIKEGIITGEHLSDSIEYSGDFDFAGTLSLDGEEITATGNEINSLTGITVTRGGIMMGDGTKISQDATALYWDIANDRLGIGTNAPSYPLDVNGSIRIGGFIMPVSASEGYVLTSDENGIASWQIIPGSSALEAWSLTDQVIYPSSSSYSVVIGGSDPESYSLNVIGDINTLGLFLNGTEIIADANELNILNGAVITTEELNLLSGIGFNKDIQCRYSI